MSDKIEETIRAVQIAAEQYEQAVAAVESIEGTDVEELPTYYVEFESILDTYEERATGSGDFRGYLEFQRDISVYVDGIPETLPDRDAFEAAQEAVDERRLQPRHFEAARDALNPVRDHIESLEKRNRLAGELRTARRQASEQVATLDQQIERYEDVSAYQSVDIEASTNAIQDPIDRYNEAIRESVQTILREWPAVDVLDLYGLTECYPLVPMSAPPESLLRAVQTREFGQLSIQELLDYAEFSRSKLDHYVDDPVALQEAVAEDRLYLERLDATPFEVPYPPPPADRLTWRLRELLSVIDRFADTEVSANLRSVQALARDVEEFDRLRTIAMARLELSESERREIARGDLETSLKRLRDKRERLAAILANLPDP